ncbi:hypothetical protein BKA70DRAFT_1215171 [Coprinopsis sp. MPI-PUGE-AT-0042]|nr:hypothetical protein BKA70DRAFT_1215171 [Coprinopsis sp. MPI-PUGE-AT-0042]
MDGIRSRGVLVSIASFIFSSFGLALSVVGSLLDLSFGHDAVAHLLAMAAGQPHKQGDHLHLAARQNLLHPSDAKGGRHRARSPSPSRKHLHHKHLPQPTSILRKTHSSPSLGHGNDTPCDRPQQANKNQLDGAATVTPPTTRARSPIPTIAIHSPDAHFPAASSDSAVDSAPSTEACKSKKLLLRSKFAVSPPSKPDNHAGSQSDSEHRSSSDSSSSDRRIGNHHHSSPSSPTRSSSSRPALPRSQSAYASDSEAARLGRAPSLRKRTPSVTFLQPIRPSKDAGQEVESSEPSADGASAGRRPNAPQIPPLGTSLSQFKRSQHRRGLSRCSSSPNLSTPPATPTDVAHSSSSSRSTSTSTFVMVTAEPLDEVQQEEVKTKTDKGHPATPSKKKTLSRMLRKIPSAPGPLLPDAERSTKMFTFAFSSNGTSKKELKTRRSQPSLSTRSTSPSPPPPLPAPKPLRTQPYEAPYFCATPDSVVAVQPKPARRKARDGEARKSSKSPMGSRVSSPDLSAPRILTASP